MIVEQIFTDSPLRNFSYIVYDENARDKGRVFCIDPWDSEQIIAFLESRNLKLTHIINSHEHADHTRGNAGLIEYYGALLWAHPNAAQWIYNLDRGLNSGEKIVIAEDSYFEVMHSPGHTFAHISLLLYRKQRAYAVFSGDTFFNAGVGNCRNGGDPSALYETISNQYAALAHSIYLYPGHEYMGNNLRFTLRYEAKNGKARELLKRWEENEMKGKGAEKSYPLSNIGLERQINLFLRIEERELRQSLERQFPHIKAKNSPKEMFLALRQLRDRW